MICPMSSQVGHPRYALCHHRWVTPEMPYVITGWVTPEMPYVITGGSPLPSAAALAY